jgi:YrbI family 3-deoxy-D-manno-octulosonate 8-phosphate phosphatase
VKPDTGKSQTVKSIVEVNWDDLTLFATDVDGTLTDGGMYYTPDGELMKRFDTRDAFGMNLLRKAGFELAIVTAENSPIVTARAKKLRIERVFLGVQGKVKLLTGVLAELGLDWKNLAYVGDDLNDLPVIEKAGFSACPSDAARQIRNSAHYVCNNPGGRGAVREMCELILDNLTA